MNKLTFLSTLFYMSGYIFKLYSPTHCAHGFYQYFFLITIIGSIVCPVSMLNMNIHSLFIYIIVAISGCLMVLMISEILSNSRISVFGDYVGKHTLSILTWHFLSFKFVTWVIMRVYDVPTGILSEFPIPIVQASLGWWMLYACVGVMFPLCLSKMREVSSLNAINKF